MAKMERTHRRMGLFTQQFFLDGMGNGDRDRIATETELILEDRGSALDEMIGTFAGKPPYP